ncbi:MAG: MAPEG family protein [Polyangiaceae bacterium]|nr:MAPEG family protein [Polyangiaceae bacterium]
MPVPVTALYGALNAILNVGLAANVSRNRGKHNVSLGSGQSKEMELAMRAHGNNAEFVPLALVMLLIAELSGGASLWLHVLGGSLFVGRVLHPIGLPLKAPNPPRFIGTALTWLMIVATAVYCLVLRYR